VRAELVQVLRCPQCVADQAAEREAQAAEALAYPDAGTDPDAITESLESGLLPAESALRCRWGHSFDLARQGYVTLFDPVGAAKPPEGDTPEMVAARAGFLAAGHFDALDAVLVDAVRAGLRLPPAAGADDPRALPGSPVVAGGSVAGSARVPDGCVVDLGAGTGHHTARVLDALPDRFGLALDVSAAASRRAARAHPRLGAVRCDVWRRLPVRTATAAVVLDVFAPRNGPEITRVLQPDGVLVVVTPTSRHLAELVGPLGLVTVDERKDERLGRTLGEHLHLQRRDVSEVRTSLTRDDIRAAVLMGPSAYHTDPATLAAALDRLPEPQPVTISVTVSVYGARLR
jgi:23S rRNA (guanine745-N1)-methyltransferase